MFTKYLFNVIAILIIPQISFAGNTSLVDTSHSRFTTLESTNITDVQWTNGFWHDRVKLVQDVTIPHLYDVMNDSSVGKSINNMKIEAGLAKGKYIGNNWQDAWVFKWIEMAVVSYAVTGDKKLDRQMDELIELIGKCQQPDGYLATQNTVRNRPRFQDPKHHEWYTMGHLLTAAALHHRITGKTNFLTIAEKIGEYGYDMFKNRNQQMAHFPINPSIIMGAVELYRQTHNPKHLELANMVIDIRGKYKGGTDCWQDRVPLRKETEVVGHAVWFTYLYAGAADAYMETGDRTLLEALERLWENLTEKKMLIHGGVCPLYRGFSFRDGKVWAADDVWEATGMDYQMPNAYGYNETCGQVGNFMWNYRMLLITGDAKYADIMEREMFNGFLGSMGQDGKSFFYVNPLRWHAHEQIMMSNSSLKRGVPGTPNIGTCCPTNYSRTLVQLQGMMYSHSDDAFWIHHYGGNKYDDGDISIEQVTSYPWSGHVEVIVKKLPAGKDLNLRIPTWAKGSRASVKGKSIDGVKEGKYVKVKAKAGDTISLDFPMDIRLMAANPKIEEARSQAAVMRGPVLYALEEVDLPDGISIEGVILPADIRLRPSYDPRLLGGVTVLKGIAKHQHQPDWTGKLYNELISPKMEDFELTLIPYYRWANRGICKMTVWMPVDY